VPVRRADGLVVSNGMQITTGDLLVSAGKYQDVTSGHTFGYNASSTRWELSDQLYVTGQLAATGGVVATGAASSFSGGVTLLQAGAQISNVLIVPIGTAFPTAPTPVQGQLFWRSDQNILYGYDGANWSPLAPAASIRTAVAYPGAGAFGASVTHIFCTAAVAITLPDPTLTTSINRPPITIDAITGNSTVAAAGGSAVFGGSFNTTTGAILDGQVNQGDAWSYKSDTLNWRTV
jgi:hypothetical protein